MIYSEIHVWDLKILHQFRIMDTRQHNLYVTFLNETNCQVNSCHILLRLEFWNTCTCTLAGS